MHDLAGGPPTDLLAGLANRHVILVRDNAHLVHQPDLLLVVAVEGIAARVDVGKEPQDMLRRDRLCCYRLGNCGCCHCAGDSAGLGEKSSPSSQLFWAAMEFVRATRFGGVLVNFMEGFCWGGELRYSGVGVSGARGTFRGRISGTAADVVAWKLPRP